MIITFHCPECAEDFQSDVELTDAGDGSYDVELDSCDCGWYPDGTLVADAVNTYLTHEDAE